MIARRVIVIALACAVSGCVSSVTVEPWSDKAKGLPFSLAEPYLLVEPQPDGSATYTWVYLPNEHRRYVVRPVSMLAKQTFEIELSHGMLAKATSKPDATDVAAKLLEGAGGVLEQKEKTQNEAAKAQREALKSAEAKRAEALAAAQKEVNEATLELKEAQAKLGTYTELNVTGEKLTEAKVSVASAQARLDVANAVLAALAPDPSTGAMNAPGATGGATGAPTVHQVAGPMLFRVIQEKDGRAQLRAVAPQASYPTSTALKTGQASSSTNAGFTLSSADAAAKHANELIVKTSATVEALSPQESILTAQDGKVVADRIKSIAPTGEKGEYKVTFEPPLKEGTYNLSLATRATAGASFAVGEALTFNVGAP
jgi:hypothetical protein